MPDDVTDLARLMLNAAADPGEVANVRPDMTTGEVVATMMRENTGTHPLDSGGTSGRAWQTDARRDFASEPSARLDVFPAVGWAEDGRADLTVLVSTWYVLSHNLEYAPEKDAELHALDKALTDERGRGEPWHVVIDEYLIQIGAAGVFDHHRPTRDNTYNSETLLDRDFQFHAYSDPRDDDPLGAEYVIIETHNGADIRGGYSTPHVFRILGGGDGYVDLLLSMTDATVYCDVGDHAWDVRGTHDVEAMIGGQEASYLGVELPDLGAMFNAWGPVDDDGNPLCPVEGCEGHLAAHAREF